MAAPLETEGQEPRTNVIDWLSDQPLQMMAVDEAGSRYGGAEHEPVYGDHDLPTDPHMAFGDVDSLRRIDDLSDYALTLPDCGGCLPAVDSMPVGCNRMDLRRGLPFFLCPSFFSLLLFFLFS